MSMEWVMNEGKVPGPMKSKDFGLSRAREAQAFHASLPGYAPTPLVRLDGLAKRLGVGRIYVKDESFRFGLNAFKALGGSYAMHRYMASHSHEDRPTFVTATDGNHGRGVAWAAGRMGCPAHVYMPEGTAAERLENIRLLGADARILPMSYDDCVRHAARQAEENGWVLLQDTAWDGYRDIPMDIMAGYTTMALEIAEQLQDGMPTHIFLQAGVGSMAAAVAAFFCDISMGARPRFIVVEPTHADCFYQTALHRDGRLHDAQGPLDSMMAGL
ncbi:MAG: diaminopropionate ammonia-lyase, partial [Clostridiales bacterium]|nr:diaminopropionate ammonia-lyase [Clostridiales bacterium]